ncbi:MAG: putative peptidoglycan glycosyltransferase FtsW [Pseudomonadota bacterium]|nr:putative peptidoglycan glycosyltransferase FtsW [Pseudomonadota bacterium]MEC8664383.1 putative peptidoglycan glycosyltransferase FtsW [Pseudomonadota bacterium]
MSKLFSRTDQSVFGHWWWTVDRGLLAAYVALVAFGVVLVTAASPPVAERIGLNEFHFIKRHLVVLVPSVILTFGISLLSPRNVWRFSSLMLIGSILALVYVLFVGTEIKGAQRWIPVLGFSLQPSEFVKPAFAVSAAWLIARQKETRGFAGGRIAAGLFGLIVLLLLLQPDLGMTVVTSCIYGAIIFMAGFPLWIVGIMVVAGAVGLVGSYFIFHHVQSRIDRFLDPSSGDSYQVQKSLEAFQNGGLFGTGPGQGTVKLSLPDAHADFIFAVAGEELGFLVTATLVSIFAFILLRGFNRIMDSNQMFIVLATGGLLTMLGTQALVHMGSSVSLLPAKGMTLPFISYGGSSLLSVSITMGMILALTRRQAKQTIAKGSTIRKKRLKAESV